MDTIEIAKISLSSDGKIEVYPATMQPLYEYIYRAAAGVYWNKECRCFFPREPQDWQPAQWYAQILGVVRSEMGLILTLKPQTEFTAAAEAIREDIMRADAEFRKWMDSL